jgi:hypothetical protein
VRLFALPMRQEKVQCEARRAGGGFRLVWRMHMDGHMKTKRAKGQGERKGRIETAAVSGAVAGAAAGSLAGPAGAVAGGIVGGVAGAMAGVALADDAQRRHSHGAELDREIGVTEGDLGAAGPDAPPARVGAYSAGSAGAGVATPTPSEGPIQDVDD